MPSLSLCRYKSDEERTPVNGVVQQTFPLLLTIFNAFVQIPNPSIEVADLIKLICKIFWSSIYVRFFFSLPFSSIYGKKNERIPSSFPVKIKLSFSAALFVFMLFSS